MEIHENSDHGAGELMDSILADTDVSPAMMPFLYTDVRAPEIEAFNESSPSALSRSNLKRIGLHHDEAFEL